MRKLLAYTTVLLIIAAVYSGWTMYSRWSGNRAAERASKRQEAEADRTTVDRLGGDKLKILSFYPSPGVVKRGGRALVCYGVANAKAVEIEPHIDEITPSLSRCLEVFPKRTTEYKLTAEDAAGHKESQSFVLQVK